MTPIFDFPYCQSNIAEIINRDYVSHHTHHNYLTQTYRDLNGTCASLKLQRPVSSLDDLVVFADECLTLSNRRECFQDDSFSRELVHFCSSDESEENPAKTTE